MSSSVIKGLDPHKVWFWFEKISKIFRKSGKEQQIIDYINKIAGQSGLEVILDKSYILVRKPASSASFDNVPSTCLQAHLDMVCVGPDDYQWENGVELVRDNGYIRANNTSLGADNGIGIAAMLALMTSTDLQHGPLEFLFTTEEEIGLVGVNKLPDNLLTSKYLINLDSERVDEICIGCAGGKQAYISMRLESEYCNVGNIFSVEINGLLGGHSGLEIHLDRSNAIKMLARLALKLSNNAEYTIIPIDISGGTAMNVIPSEAKVTFIALAEELDIKQMVTKFFDKERLLLIPKEQDSFTYELTWQGKIEDRQRRLASNLLNLLNALPHGVISQDSDFDIIRTSVNLARIYIDESQADIIMSLRSSSDTEMRHLEQLLKSICDLANVKISFPSAYPSWEPDYQSTLLESAQTLYWQIFNHASPKITVVHAGLECGFLLAKNTGMEAISIGPNILDVHSVNERVDIESVSKFWDFLIKLLEALTK